MYLEKDIFTNPKLKTSIEKMLKMFTTENKQNN